jgi:putative membrane protein
MSRTVLVVLIALALILVLAVIVWLPQCLGIGTGYGYGGVMGPWMMGGFGIFGMLGGLLILALLIGGAIWLVQFAPHGRGVIPTGPREETALEILKRRYASGDISKEQYEEMRRNLGA